DCPDNNGDATARPGHPDHFGEHPLRVAFLHDRARKCNIDTVIGERQSFGPAFAELNHIAVAVAPRQLSRLAQQIGAEINADERVTTCGPACNLSNDDTGAATYV